MAAETGAAKPVRPKKEPQPLIIPQNATDEQRLKLERLMRNPDKPVPIPEGPREWTPRSAPEFVRDVMGSSAGAGSGEFHVYRHLRRREYQRQEYMDTLSDKQRLDEEFQRKLKENQIKAEERTAKRRLKRLKKNEKKKSKKAKPEGKANSANAEVGQEAAASDGDSEEEDSDE
ncbi:PRKR-interacting protein 1 [Bufo gargarizans]|uniref:PRKR-interacting protein 1 n=1 Tax=Bufo gargarizans TaxID=30331 RepID=UPI001CF173B7|nr:PRKR-interacting protein 1 [Bufo gargarizans]